MPQMSPINWLSLFIIFFIVFLLFMVMNYFLFIPLNSNSLNIKTLHKNNFNWKW